MKQSIPGRLKVELGAKVLGTVVLSVILMAVMHPVSASTITEVDQTDTFLTTIPQSYILEQPLGARQQVANIGEYINLVYRFALSIVGVIVTVLIMIGGLIWLSSGGNEQLISQAKEMISSAVIGLIIALFSYSILYWINPNLLLVDLSVFKIPTPSTPEDYTCLSDRPLIESSGATKSSSYPDTGGNASYSASQINQWITQYNGSSNVSLTFLKAVMRQESNFKVNARSNVQQEDGSVWHACGLMQVLPTTAKQLNCPGLEICNNVSKEGTPEADACCNVMTSNPEAAICAGVRYANELAKPRYADGIEELIAAAYNGGPGAIKYSKACPGQYNYECLKNAGYQETRNYVPSVLDYKKQICQDNTRCDAVPLSTKAGTIQTAVTGYCFGTIGSTKVYSYAVCQGLSTVCPSTEVALQYTTQPACATAESMLDGSTISQYYSFSESSYYGDSTTLYNTPPTCATKFQGGKATP